MFVIDHGSMTVLDIATGKPADYQSRHEPRHTNMFPYPPHTRQKAFLRLTGREALFGGAAGGGKSDALLMAALQYVDIPNYAAIIFRKTYADLSLPGAIMDRSKLWLNGKAHWHEINKTWTFTSGATLTFGYLAHENDRLRYQSSEFQFIAFDELTQFSRTQYTYLFSRLRKPSAGVLGDVPLRMRAASNPGGPGHDWVKERFIDKDTSEGRTFLASKLADNPSLDYEEYMQSLMELDPITRLQLLEGDWGARQQGGLFKREWFPIIDAIPDGIRKWVRYWDLAATVETPGKDPDWTVGCKVGLHTNGFFVVGDVQRFRVDPKDVDTRIAQTAAMDGAGVQIFMEQEPGASGKIVIDHFRRRVLVGYSFTGRPSSKAKIERARPVSSAADANNVKLVTGPWLNAFFDELELFPLGSHDDQVDALSGAIAELRPTGGWGKI